MRGEERRGGGEAAEAGRLSCPVGVCFVQPRRTSLACRACRCVSAPLALAPQLSPSISLITSHFHLAFTFFSSLFSSPQLRFPRLASPLFPLSSPSSLLSSSPVSQFATPIEPPVPRDCTGARLSCLSSLLSSPPLNLSPLLSSPPILRLAQVPGTLVAALASSISLLSSLSPLISPPPILRLAQVPGTRNRQQTRDVVKLTRRSAPEPGGCTAFRSDSNSKHADPPGSRSRAGWLHCVP